MYSHKKIQAVLEAFEKSEGWMPQYHTLFPKPVAMQEKVAAARKKLEG